MTAEQIKDAILEFEASPLYEQMKWGQDYYNSQNTAIMERRMLIYTEDEDGNPFEMDDPYKANHKLPAGYFKILVDQKLSYLLAKPITFEGDDAELIEEQLGKRFQIILQQVAKQASKKSVGWLHPYIDDAGDLQLMPVPSEQVIPIYGAVNRDIVKVIRRYRCRLTIKDEIKEVTCIEVWDDKQAEYWLWHEDKIDKLSVEQMEELLGKPYDNPKPHFHRNTVFGGAVSSSEGLSWGMVPFVPMHNNDEETYDLQPIKNFIDAYDVINSDFCNNLEDFQDIYWVLKGYDGQNLNEFLYQVKRYKTLKTSDDGDAKAEQINIPYEARREAKEGLEKDIFTFGQGVNPNAIGDGNITNVVIRSRFAMLDMKAGQFESELIDFLYSLMEFVNKYREIKREQPLEFDGVVFNKSIIVNELELLTANREQTGSISEDTRLSNHPWVDDVDEEKLAMEAEKPEVDLDMFGGGDNEPPTEE